MTYVSVKVSLITLFLTLDLDFLCTARTALSHSWSNPVERVMLTLNLGLQCIGLMQEKGDSDIESKVVKCNSLVAFRDASEHVSDFRTSLLDSIAHVKSLLTMLLERLKLKNKKFSLFDCCTESEIESMWN